MTGDREIKRILVALDSSGHGLAALEVGAEMAARHGAHLIGIYVEDIDLLRMAGLPFAREFSHLSAAGRPVDAPAMERTMRAQTASLQRAVESVATRAGVSWSFRVARGRVSAELLAASEDADVVIVGKASGTREKRVRIGSTARAVLAGASRTVVLFQRGAGFGKPVLVIFDASDSARRALTTAASMAVEDGESLVVVVPGKDAEAKIEEASAYLESRNLRARYVRVSRLSVSSLIGVFHDCDCRTLVLTSDSPLFEGRSVTSVLERLDCPVVLAR